MSNYITVLNSNQTAVKTRLTEKRSKLNELIGDLGSISGGTSKPVQNLRRSNDCKENTAYPESLTRASRKF